MRDEVGCSRRNLYFAVGSVYTLYVSAGIIMGWASPSIPRFEIENYNFTKSQENLLASIAGLAPGYLLTIFGIDTIGRKGTLFVIWLTTVISPIIMLMSTDFYAIFVARFISGLGMSASITTVGVYISEIADVGVRSALKNNITLVMHIGVLVSYCFGPFITFFNFTIVTLVLSSVFGVLWYFLPESPYFFVAKGELDRARSSLAYIKSGATSEFIDLQLTEIVNSIEGEKRNKIGLKKLVTSKATLKQFVISFYLMFLSVASGPIFLEYYMQQIFGQAKLDFDGAYVPILLVVATSLSLFPAPLLLKKFGSRPMYMLGGFGSGLFMGVSGLMLQANISGTAKDKSMGLSSLVMVAMGIYFIFLREGYDLTSIRYLSIILLFGVMICFYYGLGVGIVWGMVSDLFAPSVKAAATGIVGFWSSILTFLAVEIFGELKDHFGFGVTFLCFGGVQIIASIGLFFVVDTTKMTLQEIQDYFEGNTNVKTRKASISTCQLDVDESWHAN